MGFGNNNLALVGIYFVVLGVGAPAGIGVADDNSLSLLVTGFSPGFKNIHFP